MPRLNPDWNDPARWEDNRAAELQESVAIPLAEVELVRQLARRVPELDRLGSRLDEMLRIAYSQLWAGELWTDFRNAIVARAIGLRAPLLRATDRIAREVLGEFAAGLGASASMTFDANALVLVGEGRGNPGDYLAWPADGLGKALPLAVIKMPEAAFWNAQRWMALPHEVGHAIYVGIRGLEKELEAALEERMHRAFVDGEVVVPDVDVTLPTGVRVAHGGEELLRLVWSTWADEAQADTIGVLAGGGAAIAEGQVVLGFANDHWWYVDDQGDRPESHPTAYVRQWMQLAILRRMGGHGDIADELEDRLRRVGGNPTQIVFWWSDSITTVEILRGDIAPWLRSAEIAAEVLVDHRFASLGGKAYGEVLRFSPDDQALADRVTDKLLAGDTDFLAGTPPARARHALAAAVWGHERNPPATALLTETLQHFLV